MQAVILFDIDGTLLTTGGAGQLAMERALAQVFGLNQINGEILAAGRTDLAITTDLFREHQIAAGADDWQRFQSVYLENLPVTMQELGGSTLPGIRELLSVLSERADVSLGLLTGNFRRGAALKLEHFAIDHHFHFGGYGDDHHNRDDVARAAYCEAVTHLQGDLEPEQVWVIGDTPADIRCARAIGAHAVAVSTGIFEHATLAACEPDLLVRDFSEPSALLQAIARSR